MKKIQNWLLNLFAKQLTFDICGKSQDDILFQGLHREHIGEFARLLDPGEYTIFFPQGSARLVKHDSRWISHTIYWPPL